MAFTKNRGLLIGILVAALVIIGGVVISNYSKQQAREEFYRLESEKRAAEQREKEAKALMLKIEQAYEGYGNAKSQLNDARSFQVFRSKSKRDNDIKLAEKNLKDWEDYIKKLEVEISEYRVNYRSRL